MVKHCLTMTFVIAASLTMAWAIEDPPVIETGDEESAMSERLWEFLQKADYPETFSTWPGREKGEFHEGRSPHGAFLKIYINDEAKKDPQRLPVNSMIVKENYTPEKELAAITVMYRIDGFDREHRDWYWVKYLPDGKVAQIYNERLAGRVQGCIDCHANAKGNDFVFANDPKPAGN